MKRTLFAALLAVATLSPPALAQEVKAPPPRFEPLDRVLPPLDAGQDEKDTIYDVAPFSPWAQKAPEGAVRVELSGEKATAGGAPFDVATAKREVPVVLVVKGETFFAQAAALLTRLDDGGFDVWLAHPDVDGAYQVDLRDETRFQMWLEEATPGKLRVVQRADGFELQTNMGKLPGPDANGPSVPARGGKMDLATLQRGLSKVKSRFTEAPDVCFMPTFGTDVGDVVRALAANSLSADAPVYAQLCLVYPALRPDGGQAPPPPPKEDPGLGWPLVLGMGVPVLFLVLLLLARARKTPKVE
ncbi:MAG: hypothetical protein HY906_22470 [Deltaproteobacteria bacterium]|nr:hypothetical protein [Deltaproteobacteria bacterium]